MLEKNVLLLKIKPWKIPAKIFFAETYLFSR